jgi:hypothetical protein
VSEERVLRGRWTPSRPGILAVSGGQDPAEMRGAGDPEGPVEI